MQGLDKYLQTNPFENDYFDDYVESFSSEFFYAHEDEILECDGIFGKWMRKLEQYKSPQEMAAIIERAHKIYVK